MALTDISFNSNFWDFILEVPLVNGLHAPIDISFGSIGAPSRLLVETYLSREIITITIN